MYRITTEEQGFKAAHFGAHTIGMIFEGGFAKPGQSVVGRNTQPDPTGRHFQDFEVREIFMVAAPLTPPTGGTGHGCATCSSCLLHQWGGVPSPWLGHVLVAGTRCSRACPQIFADRFGDPPQREHGSDHL